MDHTFSDQNYSKVCKFCLYTTSHSFLNDFLLIFHISIVQWLNCRNLKYELNRSYNGEEVVYVLKARHLIHPYSTYKPSWLLGIINLCRKNLRQPIFMHLQSLIIGTWNLVIHCYPLPQTQSKSIHKYGAQRQVYLLEKIDVFLFCWVVGTF